MAELPPAAISDVLRQEHGRAVAVLARLLGDIDLAEEADRGYSPVEPQTWSPG